MLKRVFHMNVRRQRVIKRARPRAALARARTSSDVRRARLVSQAFMQRRLVYFVTLALVLYCGVGIALRVFGSEHAWGILFSCAADVYFTLAGLLTFFPATDFEIKWDVYLTARKAVLASHPELDPK